MKLYLLSVGVSIVLGVSVLANIQEPVKVDGGLITGRPSWGWTNFAKTLNPNGPNLPDWPAYTTASERYLSIGDPTRIETIRPDALDLFSTR